MRGEADEECVDDEAEGRENGGYDADPASPPAADFDPKTWNTASDLVGPSTSGGILGSDAPASLH